MKEHIEERVRRIADYIAETSSTVRDAATVFGISKSTVHKDMSQRLAELDCELAAEIAAIMATNKAERHIRGGLATRNKYLHMKDDEQPA